MPNPQDTSIRKPRSPPPRRLVEVVAELLRPRRVAKLAQRLVLDLADPLSAVAEDVADLLQGSGPLAVEAEPPLQDAPLPVVEGVQDRLDVRLEQGAGSGVEGHLGVVVLDEVAEGGVLLLPHRALQGDGRPQPE